MADPKTLEADVALITRLGGQSELAKQLGIDVRRVWNWTVRGIPPKVKLQRPDLFLTDLPDRRKRSKSPEAKVA